MSLRPSFRPCYSSLRAMKGRGVRLRRRAEEVPRNFLLYLPQWYAQTTLRPFPTETRQGLRHHANAAHGMMVVPDREVKRGSIDRCFDFSRCFTIAVIDELTGPSCPAWATTPTATRGGSAGSSPRESIVVHCDAMLRVLLRYVGHVSCPSVPRGKSDDG